MWASQTLSFWLLIFFCVTCSLSHLLTLNQKFFFSASYFSLFSFLLDRDKSVKATEENFERKKTEINGIPHLAVCLVTQSCPTLCDPMDCSLPGSSVHRILQAGILECIGISFSRGYPQHRDQTRFSCIADRFFTVLLITSPFLSQFILAILSTDSLFPSNQIETFLPSSQGNTILVCYHPNCLF